jgi:UDP-3-O-[3-hydroxymyristoyl] N-acetylglucosamine deacetylase
MIPQRTLKAPVTVTGIGLHSGKEAQVTIRPAAPGRGIVFQRKDVLKAPAIPASFRNVLSTQLATTLGTSAHNSVSTVEHLLAALAGLGVDNAIVEVGGPEIPILDGSSAVFVREIEAAGTVRQLGSRPFLAVRRRVELRMGEKWAVVEPCSRLEIHASIEWDHPAIGYQEFRFAEGETPFESIASARTFGFLRDVEALKRMGLVRGGSLESAVVLDDASVLNPEGLRYPDEFVRHKVLDALGDFQLAGIAVRAHFRLHRAGHDLHSLLLAEVFKNPDNYEIVGDSPREKAIPAQLRRSVSSPRAAAL